jgi:hypothetical protein
VLRTRSSRESSCRMVGVLTHALTPRSQIPKLHMSAAHSESKACRWMCFLCLSRLCLGKRNKSALSMAKTKLC